MADSIDRSGAQALMPEEVQREIVQGVPKYSAAMRLMRRGADMSRKQRRVPVLSQLPTAYFVDGDTGQKKTTKMAWANKFLNAEELAVIVPIPEAVLDDSDYDIWAEVKPRIMEAFGIAFDGAAFFGTNRPASWPISIMRMCQKSGNVVVLGTGSDIADDIAAENGVMALVEADGYDVSGFAGEKANKARFRGLRATTGEPIFQPSMQADTPATLYGEPIHYVENGAWDNSRAPAGQTPGDQGGAHLFAGAFSEAVYAIRQDVTFKILDQAIIQNTDGSIAYNLAQQDMVALRAVLRLAWQVPNPINRMNPDEHPAGADPDASDGAGSYRYPFAALVPPAQS